MKSVIQHLRHLFKMWKGYISAIHICALQFKITLCCEIQTEKELAGVHFQMLVSCFVTFLWHLIAAI